MLNEDVIKIIKNSVCDGTAVTEESELFSDLGLSSLDMINLINELERGLNVNIDMTDLIGVQTVGGLITKLKKYVKG